MNGGILWLVLLLTAVQDEGAAQGREEFRRPGEDDERSSTGRPNPLERAAASVTVIRGEELRKTGVRTLTDALRLVPGLEVQRLSSTESNVAARSYNDDSSASQGVMCLVDGRQVYNEFFGAVVWDSLPVSLEEIDRIEIIRGPGSFLYGPNAMHGLVNIITKAPMKTETARDGKEEVVEDEEFAVSGAAGSYRSSAVRATAFRRERESALKATISREDIDEFPSPRSHDNDGDKAFGEVRYEKWFGGREHRLDLAGTVSDQKFNVLIPSFSGIPSVTFDSEAREGSLRGDYTWDGLRARMSWTRFDARAEPEAFYAPFEVVLDTADADLQYTLDLMEDPGDEPYNILTVGAGYRLSAFETENLDVADGRHKTGLWWMFLQDQHEIVEDVWVTAGFRLDYHTVTEAALSPRLAAVWEFAERQSLRASAGYGYRNPSLRELWFDMPVTVPGLPATPAIVGNLDLHPEQMRSFEFGYWGKPTDRLQVEMSVYYNRINRLVEFGTLATFPSPPFPPGTPALLGPRNKRKEEAYGSEVSVDYGVTDQISVFANHSYGIRLDRDTDTRIRLAPRHKANAGVRATFSDPGLTAMLWVHFFDETRFIDPTNGVLVGETGDYTLLNGRVSYEVPGTEATVFVQGFNLLDLDHREQPVGDSYGAVYMAGLEVVW